MDTILLDTKHQICWLSYDYLQNNGILKDTINKWSIREVSERKYLNGRAYINYDTIPEPTRKKLPSKEEIKAEYNRQRIRDLEVWFTDELQTAYKSPRTVEWANIILNDETYSRLKREEITECARRAAVVERAAYIQDHTTRQGALIALFYAYCSLFPNDYSMKNRFCMALKQAREKGVLSVVIDKRRFRKLPPKYTGVYYALAEGILGDRRAFDIPMCHEMLEEACISLDLKTPSVDWLKRYYKTNRNRIDTERLGKTAYEKKNGLYAKIIPALHRNSQWLLDGWEIPIYGKRPNVKGGWELYFKYVLIAVMDAHSRKIIGYEIAESENTVSILEALERAVKTTGVLPYEIVTDNHAFNKTCEAANVKAAFDKIGVSWTVDSNPRRKAILERAFRTLGDKHFKKHYGYIGQGVKTKMETGRTQQELIDEYTKNSSRFLTFEQIAAVTVSVIADYNSKSKKSLGESPDTRYEKSEQPNCFPVDEFTLAALFCKQTEYKVVHGQITIKRGMNTYEYQLPSAYSSQWNGRTAGVRYSDLERIYLYDPETNDPICSMEPKTEIHGAKADRTEEDMKNLYKNSGRIKGNNAKDRKRKDAIFNEADTINPDAIDTINKVKAPKDLVRQLGHDKELRKLVTDRGINIAKITEFPKTDMIECKRVKKKENKSPFAPKGEVEISILNMEKLAGVRGSRQ